MSKQTEYIHYPLGIELEELIKQTENAANRTRWTMIVLVLASVLICIGFYNTTPFSFAPEGIASLNRFENLPINNMAVKNCQQEEGKTEDECEKMPLPLLDVYFGEKDFKDTSFIKGINPFYRTGDFAGLKRFVCVDVFARRDDDAMNSLGKYIYDNLNDESKNLLKECEKDQPLEFPKNPITFNYLTTDLNKILADKYLYNVLRFESIVFKNKETRHLLNEWKKITNKPPEKFPISALVIKGNKSDRATNQNKLSTKKEESSAAAFEDEVILTSEIKNFDLVRFNRLLLEAAFPNEINPSADIIPPQEVRIAKDFATHLAFDENVRYVNIPFFDTSIEVNDLGAFGGISLIIILLLLRFNLSREIKNLNVAFRQSFNQDKLAEFYHRLAMRVIFVIPRMEGESVNQTLSAGAKYVCFLPVIVITLGVLYDWYSIKSLGLYPSNEVFWHLIIEDICVSIIWYLSFRCLERLMHVDEIWEDYHAIWEYYLKRQTESHKQLLSESIKLDPESDLAMVIERRINNKSRLGRFRNSNWLLRKWGTFWLGRLLSLKNLARLMPFKPLRKSIESVSNGFWKVVKLIRRKVPEAMGDSSDTEITTAENGGKTNKVNDNFKGHKNENSESEAALVESQPINNSIKDHWARIYKMPD